MECCNRTVGLALMGTAGAIKIVSDLVGSAGAGIEIAYRHSTNSSCTSDAFYRLMQFAGIAGNVAAILLGGYGLITYIRAGEGNGQISDMDKHILSDETQIKKYS